MEETSATVSKHLDPIELINSVFGEDVATLKNAKKVLKRSESKQKELEKQVGSAQPHA